MEPCSLDLRERIVEEHANCDRAVMEGRSDSDMRYRPEISRMILLADSRRLPEHRADL
jgi:hypothetical protein